MTSLPPIPHGTDTEKAIVGRLVTDLLAAGLSITVWNGGDEPELKDSTNAEAIFAELAASDQDELTMDGPDGYAGMVSLVWGNDHEIISDYSTRLESIIAPAERLAESLDDRVIERVGSVDYCADHNEHLWTRHYWLEGKALASPRVAAEIAEAADNRAAYEAALLDPVKARALFDASKGGNVRGITEDHRFMLANVFNHKHEWQTDETGLIDTCTICGEGRA